jgi:hypothetical protein
VKHTHQTGKRDVLLLPSWIEKENQRKNKQVTRGGAKPPWIEAAAAHRCARDDPGMYVVDAYDARCSPQETAVVRAYDGPLVVGMGAETSHAVARRCSPATGQHVPSS